MGARLSKAHIHSKVMGSQQAATGPKLPCRVTVSEAGWEGARLAAIAAGCSSVSDMLEKLGSGELAVMTSDAIARDPMGNGVKRRESGRDSSRESGRESVSLRRAVVGKRPEPSPIPQSIPQHIHIHTAATPAAPLVEEAEEDGDDDLGFERLSLPRLVVTGFCAALIVGSSLYVADRIIAITSGVFNGREDAKNMVTPVTGDVVAGYEVSDEYGIRPVHPVTGEANVPHNGVDLAMPIGTPIHAVGKAGDTATVKCWWDDGGGGWVVNQTADSYPGYIFQSLHMSEKGCREGQSKAGDVIAYSGGSGLGTGAHYDFRIRVDGEYVPPGTKYLESAVTGEPPKE
jgi:murein DD-endopeptidase MepM/ murein hydrolase activator NlpD